MDNITQKNVAIENFLFYRTFLISYDSNVNTQQRKFNMLDKLPLGLNLHIFEVKIVFFHLL